MLLPDIGIAFLQLLLLLPALFDLTCASAIAVRPSVHPSRATGLHIDAASRAKMVATEKELIEEKALALECLAGN